MDLPGRSHCLTWFEGSISHSKRIRWIVWIHESSHVILLWLFVCSFWLGKIRFRLSPRRIFNNSVSELRGMGLIGQPLGISIRSWPWWILFNGLSKIIGIACISSKRGVSNCIRIRWVVWIFKVSFSILRLSSKRFISLGKRITWVVWIYQAALIVWLDSKEVFLTANGSDGLYGSTSPVTLFYYGYLFAVSDWERSGLG
jgi:hypothetical protein